MHERQLSYWDRIRLPDINEADWKILRRVHPLALQRFCESVLGEIEQAVRNSARSHHERYLDVFSLVQRRNRHMARLFDDLRRSQALTMLAHIRLEGLLTEEEFSSFSQETRSAVEMLLGAGAR